MLVDIYTKEGTQSGQIELKDEIFAVKPNEHAMYQAVVAFLANKRQGNAKTKVRSEVSGGGKKPWRQKGRGTARSGSSRSPVWVGGGTIHGPKPHKFTMNLSKKVKRLAKVSALSARCEEKNLMVIEDFSFAEIKTKQMVEVIKNLKLENEKILILLPDKDELIYLSTRNIPNVTVHPVDKISTYEILNHKKLLLFKKAVDVVHNTLSN
ncbi:MAG: 50S ribosomal protein L4 [Ignavibacteriae bacterium]|nr:50S ribosomal protein L4 [Ignavibacteriota bacterium]